MILTSVKIKVKIKSQNCGKKNTDWHQSNKFSFYFNHSIFFSVFSEILPAELPSALGSQHKEDMNLLEWVQKRAVRIVRGLEPFWWSSPSLRSQMKGAGLVQPGEEKAPGTEQNKIKWIKLNTTKNSSRDSPLLWMVHTGPHVLQRKKMGMVENISTGRYE